MCSGAIPVSRVEVDERKDLLALRAFGGGWTGEEWWRTC